MKKNWPKFVQILSHNYLMALDPDGNVWSYVTAHEMHTGEMVPAHWEPIASMERKP